MDQTTGQCRLCARDSVLTFEHVPPKSTWNDGKVIEKDLQRDYMDSPLAWSEPRDERGRQMQRGSGGEWLCGPCNQFLNAQYVPSYREFAYQVAAAAETEVTFAPLRALKQIAAMFIAVNAGGPRWPEVAAFVRDPTLMAFPDDEVRVYAFRCGGPTGFLAPFVAHITASPHANRCISQVGMAPVGFQMLVGDPHPRGLGLLDITEWHTFGPDERATARIGLPLLPTFSPMPNDFRSRDDLRRSG
jgi:hypothetical protein